VFDCSLTDAARATIEHEARGHLEYTETTESADVDYRSHLVYKVTDECAAGIRPGMDPEDFCALLVSSVEPVVGDRTACSYRDGGCACDYTIEREIKGVRGILEFMNGGVKYTDSPTNEGFAYCVEDGRLAQTRDHFIMFFSR
jgi:hypothetical protein